MADFDAGRHAGEYGYANRIIRTWWSEAHRRQGHTDIAVYFKPGEGFNYALSLWPANPYGQTRHDMLTEAQALTAIEQALRAVEA